MITFAQSPTIAEQQCVAKNFVEGSVVLFRSSKFKRYSPACSKQSAAWSGK